MLSFLYSWQHSHENFAIKIQEIMEQQDTWKNVNEPLAVWQRVNKTLNSSHQQFRKNSVESCFNQLIYWRLYKYSADLLGHLPAYGFQSDRNVNDNTLQLQNVLCRKDYETVFIHSNREKCLCFSVVLRLQIWAQFLENKISLGILTQLLCQEGFEQVNFSTKH